MNANDEANSGGNEQPTSSGTQAGQPASTETQTAQPTAETQGTQPVQTQDTEPVIQMPEYELYSPAETEPTVAEQIVQAQTPVVTEDDDRNSGVIGSTTTSQSSSAGDSYINLDDYDSAEDYAKALLEGVRDSMGTQSLDDYLTTNGYVAGAAGLAALNKDVEDALGILGVAVAADKRNERDEEIQQNVGVGTGGDSSKTDSNSDDDKDEISPMGFLRPRWEGPKGEKLYLEGVGRDYSEVIFGDSNSEDTIEYLKMINENTPIAGGISGLIDYFKDDELRMITRTYEITTESINKQRVAQTESVIKGLAGIPGLIMELYSMYKGGMNYNNSADVTNDTFMNYGKENITGKVDAESICHAIADFLTPQISGNETYTREETAVYCFSPDTIKGEGYTYYIMDFTFDYTPYAWHYANVNHEEYYNDY